MPITPTSPPSIDLQNVSKLYGDLTAVDQLTLTVERGTVLGFLGPNGAGKTTTIRLLTGFLKSSSGTVFLLGHNMANASESLAARRQLGYVPDVAGLDSTATGQWLLDDLARLQGQPPIDRDALIAALDLDDHDLRRPMGRLSRGTRQKINIVQGLQHRPDLLILDEPTEGLDPIAKRALFDILTTARDRGATLFFSSHILAEVEELCDRVALIRRGRLVAVDDITALQAQVQRRVSLWLADPQPSAVDLAAIPGVSDVVWQDGRWGFNAADLPALLRALAGLPVRDVTIQPPSLADLFLAYYTPDEGADG